eukprot:CAMPEP_0183481264 /NCGR_PEP_ID=MMETSP0370-20130417/174647_1 /TAXON_ID=268820 /ORGANISM="Peridinium aciculiferum, Strain PAER-2" /LENGTH=38 /DNA_ID= /DNA_START= /DNA_END= /DNA_ORIENTATION=
MSNSPHPPPLLLPPASTLGAARPGAPDLRSRPWDLASG